MIEKYIHDIYNKKIDHYEGYESFCYQNCQRIILEYAYGSNAILFINTVPSIEIEAMDKLRLREKDDFRSLLPSVNKYTNRFYYKDDESILDDWALHIRRNYIEDTELKEDADDNAMTVEQYLHDYVIPQKGEELGATVRSADITEILISDLLEFVHQYSVPRYKLKNRSGKNNSQQGTDVIAYKYKNEDKTPNDKDELVAAEVKATLSNMEYTPIKNAIIDSRKDEHRLARSVNYCRKRLKELGKIEEAEEVKRFLFKPDNNYRITYVAAGVSSRENVDDAIELDFSGEELEIRKNELIFYVHGKKLMELAHNIYQRCCK